MGGRTFRLLALAAAAAAVLAAPAQATVGQARTSGPQYDRNPSVVQDGALTYLFFARSRVPCDRLAGCNPDGQTYDLYYKVSANGGKDYGPAQLAAANPLIAPVFYGRTIAATRTSDGTIHVFWASGGNSSTLFHLEKAPAASVFTPALPVVGATGVFNVEAVSVGPEVFVYTQECCVESGIYAYRYAGGTVTGRTLVAPGMDLPKAIVDKEPAPFRFRMTMTDSSGYPTVDVYVSSSVDGLTWTAPQLVVHETGVSHWDPNLAQLPNGRYYLHYAPDEEEGAGRQRIGVTTSNDFVNWSAPHEVTPGFTAGVEYWDYWPEGFVLGNKLTLYYTSERGFGTNPTGTGHIWTTPGLGGLDENQTPNGSFESGTAGWTPRGAASWIAGGTDGAHAVTAGLLGSWTSAPIAVEPGATYVVAADTAGAGGSVVVEQLSPLGTALGALTQTVGALPFGFFQTVDDTVTTASGVSAVRLRLAGGLLGTTTFDDVRLWQQ